MQAVFIYNVSYNQKSRHVKSYLFLTVYEWSPIKLYVILHVLVKPDILSQYPHDHYTPEGF